MTLSGASAAAMLLFLMAEAGSLIHFPGAEVNRQMFKKLRFCVIANTDANWPTQRL